ncbi:Ring finger protein [Thalictrum thalictroides]|uniref:Ring finger protein n=1 Tax=Thalictrum thalictroides TaxID=46969 RepID=A0A7J6V8C9_THATH|nr:Ring finger protein [Thalictrum thalictroides]
MEVIAEVSGSKSPANQYHHVHNRNRNHNHQFRVKKKTLQAVLDQCSKALESLQNNDHDGDDDDKEMDIDEESSSSSLESVDSETNELCDLLKSRVESPNFLEKLGSVHVSLQQNTSEEGSSWDMVNENDLWDGGNVDGVLESEEDGYVLVKQEDIVEGIACFMAAYLLSLKETKELTPNQLQEALSKTFSLKKKKGKLQKAWDGSKVIYNVASWGATAIGIYQNPAILRVASMAFWNSCHIISKLL